VQFALDEHGLFGSNVLAAKGAGLELQALNELVSTSVQGINFSLMATLDFAGRRMSSSSVLPINGRTLCYGSADAGRTVFGVEDISDTRAAAAVIEASAALNLKVRAMFGVVQHALFYLGLPLSRSMLSAGSASILRATLKATWEPPMHAFTCWICSAVFLQSALAWLCQQCLCPPAILMKFAWQVRWL
jgi:hypothetical protein